MRGRRGCVRGGAAPPVWAVGVWSRNAPRWVKAGGEVWGRRRAAGSLGWGWGAEGSTAAPTVQSLKAVEFNMPRTHPPGMEGVGLLRGPDNPTRGALARAVPNAYPPGPSRPRRQGLPLASEGIIMKVESWAVDSPSPRELGFYPQRGDSGMGRGCKGLTAMELLLALA